MKTLLVIWLLLAAFWLGWLAHATAGDALDRAFRQLQTQGGNL